MCSGKVATDPGTARLFERPLVELRRGLSFGYEPPAEQSSVICLTAPSGKYVDIRFPINETSASPVKGNSKFPGYATAGLSIATAPSGTESCQPYECTTHVEWQHPIDSSGSFSTDGADMYLLGNGDVMEIGTMMIDGELKMFKEYWVSPTSRGKQACTVAETKDGGNGVAGKGMAIKIGDFCQGVLQDETGFWLERWEAEGPESGWVKHKQSNTTNDLLPCQWLISAPRTYGELITIGGREWEVTEVTVDI